MKFVLLVEGKTEKDAIGDFLKRWLDPQLTRPVGCPVVNLRGNARLIDEIARRAEDHLDGPDRSQIIAVIGLLDLYGLRFPPDATTVEQRHAWAAREFGQRIKREKFRMFFAVHEFEAWILSQPDVLPRAVRDALPTAAASTPEKIDFDEPPSRLLNRLYRSNLGKDYKKAVYGRQLAARLDPNVVVGRCPYLRKMLEEMLQLARCSEGP